MNSNFRRPSTEYSGWCEKEGGREEGAGETKGNKLPRTLEHVTVERVMDHTRDITRDVRDI